MIFCRFCYVESESSGQICLSCQDFEKIEVEKPRACHEMIMELKYFEIKNCV